MTVKQIVSDYLKQNGYDGLHSHPENNNYGGCGCGIKELFKCGESCKDCEPAYAHTYKECLECSNFADCEAFEYEERLMYCRRKKV